MADEGQVPGKTVLCGLERKVRPREGSGSELADREDGTSSYLRAAIVRLDLKRALLLAKAGARLPRLTGGDVRAFNNALHFHRKDNSCRLSEKELDYLEELIVSRP